MENKARILLVEDDLNLGFVISDNLKEAGYEVIHCADGETAWEQFQKKPFDLALLDIMMPKKDGITLSRQIRARNEMIPLLFLTAKSMEEDKVSGFKAGADDYITKPFSMKELLLRIEVFLRRTHALHADKNIHFHLGRFIFNYADFTLLKPDNGFIQLTPKEADLLKFFCENPNKTLKRDEILLHVWGKSDYFLGRSMDVFITRLRKHFKTEPKVDIITVHGIGFRFCLPEETS